MRYALGVDVGGLSPVLAADPGDGTVLDLVTDEPPLDRLLEQVGDPALDPPTGSPTSASGRLAAVVAASAARVAERDRATVEPLVVAHPAAWGPYRTGLLRSALARAGRPAARLVPDALALATHAGAEGSALVAVLDVREDGLTVSVVRRAGDGPGVLLGPPRTIPDLGDADVADAVLTHVREVAGARTAPDAGAAPGRGGPPTDRRRGAVPRRATGPGGPGGAGGTGATGAAVTGGAAVDRASAQRLRAECERVGALLVDGEPGTLTADPLAPGHRVRMVPSELETRLRPRATRAVAAAADAVARTAPHGVDVVLVAGRLAALPLLAELLGARFDAPLVVVRDGGRAAARGAVALADRLPPGPGGPEPAAEGPGGREDALTRRERRARSRGAGRREPRPLRVAAVAGTSALLLGVLAVAVSEDAFAAGPATPGPRGATVVVTGTPAR